MTLHSGHQSVPRREHWYPEDDIPMRLFEKWTVGIMEARVPSQMASAVPTDPSQALLVFCY